MDRSSVRVFAVWARTHLREQVTANAARFGITSKGITEPQYVSGGMTVAGFTHDGHETELYKELRADLDAKTRASSTQKQAVETLIDETAYTWFNRLTALRFMEANGYTTRTLSSTTPGMVDPDLLQHATNLVGNDEFPGLSLNDLDRWRKQGDGVVYRNLLVAQCTKLAEPLPSLFGEGKRYAELLLPDNLLNQDSIIRRLANDIPEEDWQEIEIIGWLYQFYISERKDEVIGAKSTVAAQDIPAATQLFTPHWIVRYMVENSLGRLWLEAHPDSNLRQHMPYYLESKGTKATAPNPNLKPQDLTVMDPACGSGHILTYAFDLLHHIYLEQGFLERDIPTLILTHNLYGLDIDERAAQLANFALTMKARQKDRHILRNPPPPNLTWTTHTRGWTLPNAPQLNKNDWQPLIDTFKDADNLGSLTTPPSFNPETLRRQLAAFEASGRLDTNHETPKLRQLLQQATLLTNQYTTVIANPPYMGSKSFNKTLKDHTNTKYPRSKHDLFAVFIERNIALTATRGYTAMVTMQSWMFLSSYQQLREHLLDNHTIETLLHMDNMVMRIAFGTSAFVLSQGRKADHQGAYTWIEPSDLADDTETPHQFPAPNQRNSKTPANLLVFYANETSFEKIPGAPIAYWANERAIRAFEQSQPLSDVAFSDGKNVTGNNDRFLRLWWEVASHETPLRWKQYAKGGDFRRWQGNISHVIDWAESARTFYRSNASSRIISEYLWNRSGITWGTVTAGMTSFRSLPAGATFDTTSNTIFVQRAETAGPILGFVNSTAARLLLAVLNPTLATNYEDVLQLPWKTAQLDFGPPATTTSQMVVVTGADWNNFEVSWDFKSHPLVRGSHSRLADAFTAWEREASDAFYELKRLEEENNRYWINAYGLQDELNPEVPEDQITIRKANQERDIKSLISYAIGCMMGRYSLTTPGLQFAGGDFNPIAFTGEFQPDDDGILPITDEAYFEEDIVTRFTAFLSTAFGPEHLQENLTFIADTLTRKTGETAQERIRRYFVNEFITDHNRTYSKRPIYWLFTSGKERAFGALIYLHRYQTDTLAKLRNDYVLPLQGKLENEIRQTQRAIETATTPAAAKREERKLKKLKDQVAELLTYQDKLLHKADQRINIDLDDGVAYNYTLFDSLVYEGPDLKMQDMHKHSQWKRDLLNDAKRTKTQ